jgi:hypothetical protein
MAKEEATRSLPDDENQCQWSINDFWSCMMVDQTVRLLLMAMYGVLTGFMG